MYNLKMETKQKDWINPKIEINISSIGGKGMFAKEKISQGEKIIVWRGEYTDSFGAKKALKNDKLVMQWDDDLFSVEERGDDQGYFINHSCDANLWMEDAFTLIARREIDLGEEITADYALWEADENYISKWKCGCGSTDCRKKITGKDWQLKAVQEKYKDHFSPLINTRIKIAKTDAVGKMGGKIGVIND